jgi:hypothetical protein
MGFFRLVMALGVVMVMTADDGQWLTIEQVSDRLQIPVKTLRYWRSLGHGPPGTKMGRGRTGTVRYRLAAVEAWESEREAEGVAS